MNSLHRASFATSDLVNIADAPPPDSPPLFMGELCRLNSGGPDLLIVDISAETVTVSWNGGDDTHTFLRSSVRRIGGAA